MLVSPRSSRSDVPPGASRPLLWGRFGGGSLSFSLNLRGLVVSWLGPRFWFLEVLGSSPVVLGNDNLGLGIAGPPPNPAEKGLLHCDPPDVLIGSVLRYALASSAGIIFSTLTVSWVGLCLGCRDDFKAMAETVRPSPEWEQLIANVTTETSRVARFSDICPRFVR